MVHVHRLHNKWLKDIIQARLLENQMKVDQIINTSIRSKKKYYPRVQQRAATARPAQRGEMNQNEVRSTAYDPFQRPSMEIFSDNIGKSTWYGGKRSDVDGANPRFLSSSLGYGNSHRNYHQYLHRAPRSDKVYEYPVY